MHVTVIARLVNGDLAHHLYPYFLIIKTLALPAFCSKNSSMTKKSQAENKTGKHRTNGDLINRARRRFGDRFDYSDIDMNATNLFAVPIKCREHDLRFLKSLRIHVRWETGCPECENDIRFAGNLKALCQRSSANYWRTLKRRQAGMSVEQMLFDGYLRHTRAGVQVCVFGQTYPNIEEAVRVLRPPASSATIGRWLRAGMSPDRAFMEVPNPGYADGTIYVWIHLESWMGYVGQTIQDPIRRRSNHIEQAAAFRIQSQSSLHAAIRKYGIQAFVYFAIDRGTSKLDLDSKEKWHILNLSTLAPNGFNLNKGGNSGGSTPRRTTIDGNEFASQRKAAEYLSRRDGITLHAAKKRIQSGRVNVRTPAKAGRSLVKTPAYKVWSRISCIGNAASVSHDPRLNVFDRWKTFENFLADVGQPSTSGLAFTRFDKAKGFEPNNCDWVTRSESSRINAAYMKANGTLSGWTKLLRAKASRQAL